MICDCLYNSYNYLYSCFSYIKNDHVSVDKKDDFKIKLSEINDTKEGDKFIDISYANDECVICLENFNSKNPMIPTLCNI
jgi:hypothetical protein